MRWYWARLFYWKPPCVGVSFWLALLIIQQGSESSNLCPDGQQVWLLKFLPTKDSNSAPIVACIRFHVQPYNWSLVQAIILITQKLAKQLYRSKPVLVLDMTSTFAQCHSPELSNATCSCQSDKPFQWTKPVRDHTFTGPHTEQFPNPEL